MFVYKLYKNKNNIVSVLCFVSIAHIHVYCIWLRSLCTWLKYPP